MRTMGNVKTPHTKIAVLSEDYPTSVGAGRPQTAVTVPKGTLCVYIGRWVVEDLKWLADLHGRSSIAYHDADHYGIAVEEQFLTDIRKV